MTSHSPLSPSSFGSGGVPIFERSQSELDRKERKLQEIRHRMQEEESRLSPGTPKINTHHPSLMHRKPFSETVEKSIADHNRRMEKIRSGEATSESDAESVHRPSILAYSKSLVFEEPVHERLYELSKQQQMYRAEAAKQSNIDPDTGRPLFHPSVNQRPLVRDERVEDSLYKDAINRRLRKKLLAEAIENTNERKRNMRKVNPHSIELARSRIEKELREAFQTVDDADTGVINHDQLAECLVMLGLLREMPETKRDQNNDDTRLFNKLFSLMDPDETDAIEFETFLRYMTGILDPSVLDEEDNSSLPDGLSPTKHLAFEFRKLLLNRMAYRKTKRPASASPSTPGSQTRNNDITPPHSRLLSPRSGSGGARSSSLTPRGDHVVDDRLSSIFEKDRLAKLKVEAQRREKQEDELKECTFHPQINSLSKMLGPRESPVPRGLQLYELRNRPKTSDRLKKAQEIEIEQHCTFRPDTSLSQRGRRKNQKPQHVPPGYQEAIERMRLAKEERKALQAESFEDQLRADVSASTDSPSVRAPTSAKPFEFELDKRRRAKPVLFIDVNLGNGKTGRIGIHEGDDPAILARNFASSYRLDEFLMKRLEELITQHMTAQCLPIPQREENDGNLSARDTSYNQHFSFVSDDIQGYDHDLRGTVDSLEHSDDHDMY